MTTDQNHSEVKGRILLVDDDKSIRDAVCTLLDSEGYPTTAASNGARAVILLHRTPRSFDLLVTDCNMPGMSGAEVARACLCLNPEMGILYMSGIHQDEELLDELKTGRRAFLSKPFLSDELLRNVRQLLAPRFERDLVPFRSPLQFDAELLVRAQNR